MHDDAKRTGNGRRILTLFLVVGNLAMLAAGIVTIPPNLRAMVDAPRIDAATKAPPSTLPAIGPQEAEPIAPHTPPPPDRGLSTEERPKVDEFAWYTESVFYDGVPADAVTIDRLDAATGGWKALILYDPEGVHDASALELLNMTIDGTEESLQLTLDWYLIFWLGDESGYDETDMEDSVFAGQWDGGTLWASGAGTIHLTEMYEANGRQYAIGTLATPDGIPAYVALVRP
ncbi:MAG: hypothetical protein GX649_07825 [Chloroflexi bacterium]|nr:hypothetical protein [Chloroflexota bacterium]